MFPVAAAVAPAGRSVGVFLWGYRQENVPVPALVFVAAVAVAAAVVVGAAATALAAPAPETEFEAPPTTAALNASAAA